MGWYMHATLSDFNYCSYKEIPGEVSGTGAAAFLQKRYSQDAVVLGSTLNCVSMLITTQLCASRGQNLVLRRRKILVK